MNGAWLFLAAYAASGLAGLIYEVAWVRTLTLYMGHTTAATSTVVAAFMGGMAAGAGLGGRIAARLPPRRALVGYALLESVVVVMAMAMPFALSASTPVLKWAYQDGAPGAAFPIVRLLLCLGVLILPTAALGATFPFAVRWFVSASDRTGQSAGRLYAANTAGAAIGTLGAGFLLIPAIGVIGTTLVGVAASVLAIVVVLIVARRTANEERTQVPRAQKPRAKSVDEPPRRWLAGVALAFTGFATFLYEITWTRVFSLIIGPSTYAFAATVTGMILGPGRRLRHRLGAGGAPYGGPSFRSPWRLRPQPSRRAGRPPMPAPGRWLSRSNSPAHRRHPANRFSVRRRWPRRSSHRPRLRSASRFRWRSRLPALAITRWPRASALST